MLLALIGRGSTLERTKNCTVSKRPAISKVPSKRWNASLIYVTTVKSPSTTKP